MRELLTRGLLAVLQPTPPGQGSGGRVSYSPDWSLFADGKALAQQGLNLLAAIGLVACAGFFIWGAILAAGGTSSQIPHNVARGKLDRLGGRVGRQGFNGDCSSAAGYGDRRSSSLGGYGQGDPSHEVRTMNAASELVEDAFRWLQEHYDTFSFYQERDLVWTIQRHLATEIRRRDLDLRVWNDYPMFRQGRRAESADLVLQATDRTIKVAIEFKYEPSHTRPDIQRRKLPVVFWGSDGVAHDIQRVRRFVAEGKAEVAYAVFVDEGSYFRHREAHAGSRWIDWQARTPDGHKVAILWSRWPADEP